MPGLCEHRLDLSHDVLPLQLRPGASMHVLDITKYFGSTTGGIRTYLMEKAAWVGQHPNLRQTLVVPSEVDGVTDADGVRCYGVRSPRIPLQQQYRAMVAPETIRRIIDHERPDVIEVGSPFLVPWLVHWANRGLRVPAVWFFHSNVTRLVAPRSLEVPPRHRWRHALARRYVGRVSRLFDAVVATSDFSENDLRRAGVSEIRRVTMGVDLHRFHPDRQALRDATRRRLGWPAGPVVVYLGRLAREKRLDVAVRAWRALGPRAGATLVLMGDGPDGTRLRRLAAGDRVLWQAHDPDRERVAEALAAADVYLAPGPVETFGLSALEAMACGTPVVTVDRGAVPELVRRSEGGMTFPNGNADALARTLETMLELDLQAMGRRARQHVERYHRWDEVFPRLFDMYRTVMV
jgi:alpha-1,6-mannosyltransferase